MRWRTIYTDSESMTGIAPACPVADLGEGEHLVDDVAPVTVAEHWVFDCCPHPHIECYGEASAQALAVFLTALDAKPCD